MQFKFILFILFYGSFCLAKTKGKVINVKDYGAKGDGITDDYSSILTAANRINEMKGGELFFPKGTYIIKPYHTKANKVVDIVFRSCEYLIIKGDGAVVLINGSFKRKADYQRGDFSYSYTNAITPFSFVDCSNLKFEGIEINGGAKAMSRDAGVAESKGHILKFSNCKQVVLKDILVHYAQTDGLYKNEKCSDFTFFKVRSEHNARQGMSIMELQNGVFDQCTFSNNGKTEGEYGGHAPRAGVDIEPSFRKRQIVRNIEFKFCLFENNLGTQFSCTQPKTTQNITLKNCKVNSGNSKYMYQMILSAKNLIIQESSLDVGYGNIYPVWNRFNGSSVIINKSILKGSNRGIVAVSNNAENKLTISNNELYFTGIIINSYFPYLKMPNLFFVNNKIKFPSALIKQTSIALIQNGNEASGNTFFSDNPNRKPKVSYTGTKIVKDN